MCTYSEFCKLSTLVDTPNTRWQIAFNDSPDRSMKKSERICVEGTRLNALSFASFGSALFSKSGLMALAALTTRQCLT